MASSDAPCPGEVEIELLPFIRVYKNGSIERLLGTDTVPASFDATTGVASKDVTVDPSTGLSVRLYLPPAAAAVGKKLPVLVYFHGGGFMVESAASPTYHRYLNALAARAGALAVSVEYRRVPEHPLPAAYDDCWAALPWAVAGCAPGGPEPWLAAHGDASRVFLGGDSAGANAAHNVALRAAAAAEDLPLPPGAAIAGVMLVHPYLWDPSNAMAPELEVRIRREWRFMCARPDAEVDDPRLCPTCTGASARLAALPCRRVMVAVAGDDFLAPKGRAYYEALLASGWRGEAELVDTPGQEHVFHLMRPETEAAAEMLDRVADFISRA